jgi:pyruvate,water dikinase
LFDTVLDVDKDHLREAVIQCWQSLYSERAVAYRNAKGITATPSMAVVVQQFVEASISGVAMPAKVGSEGVILVEAVKGRGDKLVSGEEQPSVVLLSTRGAVLASEGDEEVLQAISSMTAQFKQDYLLDREWVMDSSYRFFFVQERPMTSEIVLPDWEEGEEEPELGEYLARGIGASRGVVTAPYEELLITQLTKPEMLPQMLEAKAIVTEIGGLTCHAAVVSRELGKPCVVGVGRAGLRAVEFGATSLDPLARRVLTVDGSLGVVRRGE